ncbi:endoplasmic reticulum aminopeptidase 2 [Alosa sapidissima]|uniref:endoplasmic reticulum aminopeptidase 2 n=1 Tax=Alosa sapidissima TaxID=34773 RepID=UPI001C08C738|nr:endoplasmic reticulum aminopeptidase 2 [Alosa sapidissima]XP_041956438.1 endoplasmic reticulum aminopeptidase 2 [Alosa sapidissima]
MLLLVFALLPLTVFGTDHAPDSKDQADENVHTATNGLPFPWSKVRLPNYIVPVHYHLLVHPNLTTLHFIGSAKIEIDVKNNTNWVVLHSKGLNITSATVLDESEAHLSDRVLPVLEYPTHEQIAIFSPKILTSGEKYFLYLEFDAPLGSGFYGLYRSTYKTKKGETRVLASTHFEPTSARMAFPCFDEPIFKANYSIRIRRQNTYISLSNMPIEQTVELPNGILEDRFDTSVQMSSYLVAFIVCDFKSVTQRTSSGVEVSIYAVPDKWHQTHYALEAAVRILEFYEKYFNIYYPLPKLDLIAIPDFQSGAMENWGLNTYRETALLFDPATSSASDQLWVTMVIGHELAHQWFGNLVTMEWWNDIWLNEGFARYMEFVSVDATYPELNVEDYLLHTCFAAIGRDSLNSSRPISCPAENPTQIKEMFDTVSYDKGACILHMLRHFLSDEVFQSGIVRYLRKFRYKNTKNQDLWDSMANTCSEDEFTSGEYCYTSTQATKNAYRYAGEHMDLRTIMNTWTLQRGIPLVKVHQQGSKLYLKQERFIKTSHPGDPQWASLQKDFLWHIPLTYKTSHSGHNMRHLLDTESGVLDIDESVDWVKLNTDMNGYYIVHYEGDGWERLSTLLRHNFTALSHKDRANLIHNSFQLVTAGQLSLDTALDLITYLKSENHNVPLIQGLGYLETFYKMIEKRSLPDVTQNVKDFILQFFQEVIDRQMWNDVGSISDRRLRSEVLTLACDLGYPPCLEKAKPFFSDWMKSNSTLSIPSDVVETVFCVGAQNDEGWEYLLQQYTTSMSEAQKDKILSALATTKDPTKLIRILYLGMEGQVIKTMDLPSLIINVARNPNGHILAWNFVKKNWNSLVEKFQLGSFSIRNIIIGTTSQFSSKEELHDIKEFFESIKDQSSQVRVTKVALENVEKNIMWLDRNLETLRAWLLKTLKTLQKKE